jgi:phytoene dehydrogenase-like protein
MGRFDAVIAGGGHNGLVAATLLARAGWSVCVLERRDEVGGAAVSAGLWPGVDARVSRYAYLVSLFPSSLRAQLGLTLELRQRGGREPAAFADPAVLAWRELTARAATAFAPTLLEPLRSREQVLARVDGEVREALFEAPLSVALEARIASDEVRGTLLTDALIGTFASASEPSLRQNRCFLYHVIGDGHGRWDVPVGGMGRLTGELAAVARAAGAELRVGVEVESIEADGLAAELACSGGSRVAARHVLIGAGGLALPFAADGGGDAAAGAGGERPGGAQLKINMLMRRLPRLRDSPWYSEEAFRGTFHVNEGYAQLQRAHDEAAAGTIPSLPPCELYCHSLTDPSILGPDLRLAGAQTLTLFGLQMPARLFRGDPAAHAAAKANAVAATIRSLESVLAEPLEDCLFRDADGAPCLEALTPIEVEAELGMPGGHIFHRDLRWPFAESEAEVGTWGVETSIANVWICGAAARRGGGVSGIPGHNAARAVLAAG